MRSRGGIIAVLACAIAVPSVGVGAIKLLKAHYFVPRAVAIRTYEFGVSEANVDVPFKIEIKNEGHTDLVIKDVTAECHCTNVAVDQQVIPPSQSAIVHGTYRTPDRAGVAGTNVIVTTNDPNNEVLALRIEGRLEPTLQIIPAVLDITCDDDRSNPVVKPRAAFLYNWNVSQPFAVDKLITDNWISAEFIPQSGTGPVIGKLIVEVKQPRPIRRETSVVVVARFGSRTLQQTLKVIAEPSAPVPKIQRRTSTLHSAS